MRNVRMKNIGVAGVAGVAGLATILMLTLALGAAARPGGEAPGGEGRGMSRLFDRLDLSDETRSSLEAVLERSRAEGEPLREAVKAERDALEALLAGESVDPDAALAQVDRIGIARTAFAKHRVLTSIEMRAFMSADERAAWDEFKDARKDRRQRMRGQHHGPFGQHDSDADLLDELAWEGEVAPLP